MNHRLKYLEPGQSEAGWHEKLNLMKCPRKYAFAKAGVEPTRASAPRDFFIRGHLGHTWLAHHYIRRTTAAHEYMEPDDAVLERIASEPEGLQRYWHEQMEQVADACIEYEAFWEAVDARYSIVKIESELATTIDVDGRECLYTQRVDLAVRDAHTGKFYIWDHKFLARSSKAADKYAIDGQFVGYHHLGRLEWGADFGGVIANIIRWGTKSNPVGFERVQVLPAPHVAKTFWDTVRHAERVRHTVEASYDVEAPASVPGLHSAFICGGCRYNYDCRWGV